MMGAKEEGIGVLLKLFSTDDKAYLQTKLKVFDIYKT